ncbi:VOC family protein [Rhodococcus zopfii]
MPAPPKPTETAVFLGVAKPNASPRTRESTSTARAPAHSYSLTPPRDDVDALLAAACSAGGRITAPAASTGQGEYAGRFTDPDGHHWEVAVHG